MCSSVNAQSGTYQLVWADEFDSTAVDLNKWDFQIGNGCPDLCGWGNNELQYYRSENTDVQNGILTINIKQESFGGYNYTSTRMRTLGLEDWTYGKFEARMKLPKGQGIWPAFWMLPSNNFHGTWPWNGELDIMEMVGHEPEKVHGTMHYGDIKGGNVSLPSGDFSDAFHVFSMIWDTNSVEWFLDSVKFYGVTKSGIHPFNWPFDQPFHLLINCAVGGNWPGNPDGTTVFPQDFQIDYVRVYQKVGQTTGISDQSQTQEQLQIFPNPAAAVSYMMVHADKPQLGVLNIIDGSGRSVYRQEGIKLINGANRLQMDLDLSAGVYYVSVDVEGQVFRKKLLVLEK